jgi:DNA repair exonuclease SbcCD ATPase subunit
MRILSVHVENYRVLRAARVEFDPGRTVVGGHQEVGKSTLVEAIHHAFFLKSRGSSAVHKAMQSDLHEGHPTVSLAFETGGRCYTIKKVFAGNSATSATLLTDDGPSGNEAGREGTGGRTLRGDEAETRIHELLQAENLGSRTVDSRLKMQWAHLWVWQGSSGHDPVGQANSDAHAEQLRDRLGRLGGGGVLESSLDARVFREIDTRHTACFRENGEVRTGSELARADEERRQADGAFTVATNRVDALDSAVDAIDAADQTLATAVAKLAIHSDELRKVGENLRTAGDLRIRLAEEQAIAREAQAAHDEIQKADDEINACDRRLTELAESIEPATERLAELTIAEEAASGALAEALDAVDSSGTRHQEAATAVNVLELCEQRARLMIERHGLGGRCARIDALQVTMAALEAERGRLAAITDGDVSKLEELERARDSAAITLEAIATKVECMGGPGPAHLAGTPLSEAEPVTITAESELVVGSPGAQTILRISPGGGRTLSDATRAGERTERELRAALDDLKIASVAEARQIRARLQAIEADITAQRGAVEGLGGDRAHRELEALITKISSVEAEIHRRGGTFAPEETDGPHHGSTSPPAVEAAMRLAEAMKAAVHARLVAAHAARDAASAGAARATASATAARKRYEEVVVARRHLAESMQATRAAMDSLTARRDLLVERFGTDRGETVRSRCEAARRTNDAAVATLAALTALDPESLGRERTRLERAITNLQSQRQAAETARQVAREQLRREGTEDPRDDLARAAVRRRLAEARLTHARREAEATRLLVGLFAAKKREVEAQFAAPLTSRVNDYLRTILGPDTAVELQYSGGRFERLSVARGSYGNVTWDFSQLSGGTKEQVAAAFRLAMAEILAEGHDGTLPIIFDDAFTNADDDRLARLQRLLDLAADRGLQIIVFSCTPQDYAGLGARQVELSRQAS